MDIKLLGAVFILGVMVGGIGVALIVVVAAQKIVNGITLDAWREEDEEQ